MLTLTVSFPGRHPAGQTGIDLKRKKLLRWLNTVLHDVLLLMQFSTHAQLGLQKRHGVNRVFILFTQQLHYLWYFSLIGHSVFGSFNLLLQRDVRKGNVAKNPTILTFFCCYQKNQVQCSTCKLSPKFAIEWKIALSKIRLFLKN